MPKKHSGITKANNGSWMIHTRIALPDGSNTTITRRGYKTERSAFESLEKMKQKRFHDFIQEQRPLLWADAAEEYWKYYSSKNKETTVKNSYYIYKKHIIDPFANYSVIKMMLIDTLREFKKRVESLEQSGRSKNRLLRYMRACINYHYQRGNITVEEFKRANIELEAIYSQDPIQKERPTWTIEEFQKFLNTFEKSNKYYVLFEVFGHTGVRIGELRGLMVKNFDREKKEIFINQQVTSKLGENAWKVLTPKTKASIRHIPLSPRICALMSLFIDDMGYGPNDFIFFGKDPVGETSIDRILKKHAEMARIKKISAHCIRHSNTTWLLNSPNLSVEDIALISQRLGHNSKKVTLDIYYHIQNKDSSATILKALI